MHCVGLFCTLLQMDLKLRFVAADVSDVVKVNELEVGRKYPIANVRRLDTKYGESILITTYFRVW